MTQAFAACRAVTQLRQLGPSAPGGRFRMKPPEEALSGCLQCSVPTNMPCISPLRLPLLAQPRFASQWGRQHECCGADQSCALLQRPALRGEQALWPAAGGAGVVTGAAAGTLVALLACACRKRWRGAAAGGGVVPGAGRASLHGCQAGHWQGAMSAAAGMVAGMLACASRKGKRGGVGTGGSG